MVLCCPDCGSKNIKKNGHIHNGKQNHQCNRCGRQFVKNPKQKRISDKEKDKIKKLLKGESAKKLWQSIPKTYRQKATFYTDDWEAYKGVIPSKQHRIANKQSGKINHIERFNCTMRQRISRLVRKALSFSKKLANHIGAIKYFICHYNLEKALLV